jgi:hypothetical protein
MNANFQKAGAITRSTGTGGAANAPDEGLLDEAGSI